MGNMVVILSDEHQARALSCAGHPIVKTPHLDALAARGTRFEQAYTPSPICVPARASFATGLYPHQTRLWDNAMPYTGQPRSWGHILQDAGVQTHSIGKLHYRDPGDDVGFDAMEIPMMVADGVGMVWASERRAETRKIADKRMLGAQIGAGESDYTRYDAAVTARAVEWLHNNADNDRPWCLYIGLVAPHFPLLAPPKFFDLYRDMAMPDVKLHPDAGHARHPWVEAQNAFMDSEAAFRSADERLDAMRAYFGLCSYLDDNIGKITGAIEAAGLAESTTIIYSSDHGDNLGARGLWGKSNFYEESVAVPMIMAGPDVPVGTCATPVSLLDLSVSIPHHFGAKMTEAKSAEPLPRILARDADPDRPVFAEYHAAGAVSGGFMLRTGRWKLMYYINYAPELYDLEDDPEELNNLADEACHAETLAGMTAQLREICDPEQVDAQAFADQDALIARFGGREAAFALGAPGATPPPKGVA